MRSTLRQPGVKVPRWQAEPAKCENQLEKGHDTGRRYFQLSAFTTEISNDLRSATHLENLLKFLRKTESYCCGLGQALHLTVLCHLNLCYEIGA